MIKSMTGFGKGEADSRNGKVKAEVRTVNHKFLDVSTKLPDGLLGFEDKIREMIAKFVKRGKVNLNLVYENHIDSADKIVVDEKLAKTYYKLLTALKKKMDLEGSIRLDQLIALPGVITYEPKGVFPAKIWPFVEKAVKRAFEDLKVSRLREGRALSEDIKKRIRLIKAAMGVIKDRSKVNVKLYRNRLKNSTMEVSKGSAEGFDKTRFEQEVAL